MLYFVLMEEDQQGSTSETVLYVDAPNFEAANAWAEKNAAVWYPDAEWNEILECWEAGDIQFWVSSIFEMDGISIPRVNETGSMIGESKLVIKRNK